MSENSLNWQTPSISSKGQKSSVVMAAAETKGVAEDATTKTVGPREQAI